MKFIVILIFIFFIASLVGFIILFSYFLNSSKREQIIPDHFRLKTGPHKQGISIKFYQLLLFFITLCIQAVLLFPWVINFDVEYTWMFLFLTSIIIVSYMFVWFSKGLDWKK